MSEHGDLICLKPDKAINAAIDDDVKVDDCTEYWSQYQQQPKASC